MKWMRNFFGSILVLVTLGGCVLWDMMFYHVGATVKPSDLVDFSQSTVVASDSTQALSGLGSAMGLFGQGMMGLTASSAWDAEWNKGLHALRKTLVTLGVPVPQLLPTGKSVTITKTEGEHSISGTIAVVDEVIDGSTINPAGGSGTITFSNIDLTFSVSGVPTETDPYYRPDGISASFDLATQGSFDAFATMGGVSIENGMWDAIAKGSATMDFTYAGVDPVLPPDSITVGFDIKSELKMGFSLSSSNPSIYGGKYIVEFSYWANLSAATFDPQQDPSTQTYDTGFTMRVRIYNNSDQLTLDHTFTEEELRNLASA